MPVPPQVWPSGQAPQSMVPPQPSPILPQYWPPPLGVQVTSVQVPGGGRADVGRAAAAAGLAVGAVAAVLHAAAAVADPAAEGKAAAGTGDLRAGIGAAAAVTGGWAVRQHPFMTTPIISVF